MNLIPANSNLNTKGFVHLNSTTVKKCLARNGNGNVSSLNIFICLADDDKNWLLKIRNEEGDSVAWNETFATAKEALNEGLRAINSGDVFVSDNDDDKYSGDAAQSFAIIIHYKQEFVNWLNSGNTDFNLSVVDANFEPNIYLVDGIRSLVDKNVHLLVQSVFEEIFESELLSWCDNEIAWPQNRDWALFQEMFDFTVTGTGQHREIPVQNYNFDPHV